MNAETPIMEVPVTVVGERDEGTIDRQIATAKHYPRSVQVFMDELVEYVTHDPATAEECFYILKRGGKTIEGPSSRLAEIAYTTYLNCRTGARIVRETPEFVVAQGFFYDVERNVYVTSEIARRITDKNNRRFSTDMIVVTQNAACSIAMRNAVFRGIPKVYWKRAYDAARRVVAGDERTLVSRRAAAMEIAKEYGGTPEKVFATLEVKGIEEIGIEELAILRGIISAIREGDTNPDEAWTDPKAQATLVVPPQAGTEGLKAALAAREGASATNAATPDSTPMVDQKTAPGSDPLPSGQPAKDAGQAGGKPALAAPPKAADSPQGQQMRDRTGSR